MLVDLARVGIHTEQRARRLQTLIRIPSVADANGIRLPARRHLDALFVRVGVARAANHVVLRQRIRHAADGSAHQHLGHCLVARGAACRQVVAKFLEAERGRCHAQQFFGDVAGRLDERHQHFQMPRFDKLLRGLCQFTAFGVERQALASCRNLCGHFGVGVLRQISHALAEFAGKRVQPFCRRLAGGQ